MLILLQGCGSPEQRAAEYDLRRIIELDSVDQRDDEFEKFLQAQDKATLHQRLKEIGFLETGTKKGCRLLERKTEIAVPVMMLCEEEVTGFIGPPEVRQ